MDAERSPYRRRDRTLSTPGNTVLKGNVSTAMFNSTGNAPTSGRLPVSMYGAGKGIKSPASRTTSGMSLKILSELPRFPYVDTYFDLNVLVVDLKGIPQKVSGLRLGVTQISASPCEIEVNHTSSLSRHTTGLYSMRVKILDDWNQDVGRKLRLKVEAEGEPHIAPAFSEHLTVVRYSLKISEGMGQIPDRLVADSLEGPHHIELKVHLARPTGDRVKNRKIPLRVGVDYENRWTACPGKTCRILGVTGARAVDDRGEVTLRVPFVDMCKDWPSPPFSKELRFIVEPDLENSDIAPATTKRITVTTTGDTKMKPRRSRATVRFKPLSFTRKLVLGLPELEEGRGSGAKHDKVVKRSQSFDSSVLIRPWMKNAGRLALTTFEISKAKTKQSERAQDIPASKATKIPDAAEQRFPANDELGEAAPHAPSMRRRTSSDSESYPRRMDDEGSAAARDGTKPGAANEGEGYDGNRGDDEGVDSSGRSFHAPGGAKERRVLGAHVENSRPILFPASRRGGSDTFGGGLFGRGTGASASTKPGPAGASEGDDGRASSPATEDAVFYVVTTCYTSRKRELLGYPVFDRSRVLIGFYDEVRTRRGRCQMVFNPLGKTSSLDDKDRSATKAILGSALGRGNPSVLNIEEHGDSVEEMKNTALRLSRRRMSTKTLVTDPDDSDDDSDHRPEVLRKPQSPTRRRWQRSSFRRNPSFDTYDVPFSKSADDQASSSFETPTTVAMSTTFSNNALESIRELGDPSQSDAAENDTGSQETRLSPSLWDANGVSLFSSRVRDVDGGLDRSMNGGRRDPPAGREAAGEDVSGVVADGERVPGAEKDPESLVDHAWKDWFPPVVTTTSHRSADLAEAGAGANIAPEVLADEENGRERPDESLEEAEAQEAEAQRSSGDLRPSGAVGLYRSEDEDRRLGGEGASTAVDGYHSDEGVDEEPKVSSAAADRFDSDDDSDRGAGEAVEKLSPFHRRWRDSSFRRDPSLGLSDPWFQRAPAEGTSFRRLDSIGESADRGGDEDSEDILATSRSSGSLGNAGREELAAGPNANPPDVGGMWTKDAGGRDGYSGIDRDSEIHGLFYAGTEELSISSSRDQGWTSRTRSPFGRDPEERGGEDAEGEAAVDDAESAGDGRDESGAEPNMEGACGAIVGRHCVAAR